MILWSKNQLTGQGLQSAVRFQVDVMPWVSNLHMHPSTYRVQVSSCIKSRPALWGNPPILTGASESPPYLMHHYMCQQAFFIYAGSGLCWPPANFAKASRTSNFLLEARLVSIIACMPMVLRYGKHAYGLGASATTFPCIHCMH